MSENRRLTAFFYLQVILFVVLVCVDTLTYRKKKLFPFVNCLLTIHDYILSARKFDHVGLLEYLKFTYHLIFVCLEREAHADKAQ